MGEWYARYVVVYVVTMTNTTCRSEGATKEKEEVIGLDWLDRMGMG